MSSVVTIRPYDWEVLYSHKREDNLVVDVILMWCLDIKSRTTLLMINDYQTYCYFEMPLKTVSGVPIKWSYEMANIFYKKLSIILKNSKHSPVKFEFKFMKTFYYYQPKATKPIITMWFNSTEAMKHCVNLTRMKKSDGNVYVKGIGMLKCSVWENNVNIVKKMLIDKKCKHSQWVKVLAAKVVNVDKKISKIEREFVASFSDLKVLPECDTKGLMTHPSILVFDVECYSDRYNSMPKSRNPLHACFMISVIFQKMGLCDTRERYMLTLGSVGEIKGTNVITFRFDQEKELLLKFIELISTLKPNIISGHNIFGFDWKYIYGRCKVTGVNAKEWDVISLLKNKKSKYVKNEWDSSGTGTVNMEYIRSPGFINIDTLYISRREFKLRKYTLESVSQHLLGRGKHDVSPKQMFIAYEENMLSEKLMEKIKCGSGYHKNIARCVIDEVLSRFKKNSEELTKVAKYCIEDSELVIDILEKMNCWISMIETSNAVGVSIFSIYTRGQQHRVLSKVLDTSHSMGIVVDSKESTIGKWNGGHVAKPITGLHDYVCCHDFKSLYPMIIIYKNICHSTLVLDKSIPDSDCNICEWVDSNGKKWKFRYIKQEIYKGVLPTLERSLLSARQNVKDMLKVEKDSIYRIVLDKRQAGIKVTCNSVFGSLGVRVGGKLSLPEGAMSITAMGRNDIITCNNYLENKGFVVIYNDTDSTFSKYKNTNDKLTQVEIYRLAVQWGKDMAKELTKLFPAPMSMELEKVGRMFSIGKKMYTFREVCMYGTNFGEFKHNDDIMFKGDVIARREASPWKRETYKKVLIMILDRVPFKTIMKSYITNMYNVFKGDVEWECLLMSRSRRSGIYKSKSAFMKVFSDRLSTIGINVEKGDRLEYLILEGKGNLGSRAITSDLYKEMTKTGNMIESFSVTCDIDKSYYIEDSENSVMGIIGIAFSDELHKITESNNLEDCMLVINEIKKRYNQLSNKIDAMLSTNDPEYVLTVLNKSNAKIVTECRRAKVSGRYIFNNRLTSKPATKLSKAYKLSEDNLEKTYFNMMCVLDKL
ncbi:MAG: hypothetical protein JKY22_00365 [Flavobacteriaceae bacterium]|nr:hypothetical protein [Flavobacteriaceae bacterium]PCJ29008.1 MAG: hypothetical protein COA94_02910 [Rickettsiales bacterium]